MSGQDFWCRVFGSVDVQRFWGLVKDWPDDAKWVMRRNKTDRFNGGSSSSGSSSSGSSSSGRQQVGPQRQRLKKR